MVLILKNCWFFGSPYSSKKNALIFSCCWAFKVFVGRGSLTTFSKSLRFTCHMFSVMDWVANEVRLGAWHHELYFVHSVLYMWTFVSIWIIWEALSWPWPCTWPDEPIESFVYDKVTTPRIIDVKYGTWLEISTFFLFSF